jgi:hypothetical protein
MWHVRGERREVHVCISLAMYWVRRKKRGFDAGTEIFKALLYEHTEDGIVCYENLFDDDDSGLLSRIAGLQIPDVSKNLTAFIFKRQDGVKNKVRPRTGYEGPEGDYRYRSTLSLTSALDGDEWLTPHLGRFIPGKGTRYPLHRMLGEPGGRSGLVRKISPSPGFDSWTVQLVVSRYTD